jgi:hypothetical protein
MKIKVSETKPIQLDWLVAKCEGIDVVAWEAENEKYFTYYVVRAEVFTDKDPTTFYGDPYDTFYPTTNWAEGGPIIEREMINTAYLSASGIWYAVADTTEDKYEQYGPTPLIAAMRCYVASKLGEEVEIPEELV